MLVAPWLVMAYASDCISEYRGGGASIAYVAVILWGIPSGLFGALMAIPILDILGVEIER